MADDIVFHRDFFISRAGRDAEVAVWLGKLITAQGKTYVLQDEHFGHQNFMGAMDAALGSGARVVALLSQAYTESDYCFAEAAAALQGDPLNRLQRLILLRVEPCAPGGLLGNVRFHDLLDERRAADSRPLALKILRALGFDHPRLDDLPPPPEGVLSPSLQVLHPEVQAVPGFAGRAAELAALEEALWTHGGTAAITNAPASAAAVKGLGGVGKSVLAKEYAWRNRARYQGVWWLRAERRETLADDLIELGARTDAVPGIREIPERDQAARRALDWIEGAGFERPWLLVYDNVEEPGHIDGLTPRAGAHVLITTRWSDWGRAAAHVAVGVFPPDVAAEFLLESTGRSDRAGAESLAAALGHLPLALDHAAAYIRRTGIDFAAYEALVVELLGKAPKGVDYDTPVLATFALAIDKASEACPDAQKLMGLSAFLAPDRIPLSLFTDDVLSASARVEAVAALQEVSLATPEPLDDGSPGLTLHRLVQAAMRERLKEMGEHDNAAALATELVADAYPNPASDVRNWPACARLTPHAVAVFEHAPDSGNGTDKTSLLLNQTALNFASRAAYAEAEPLMRRALAINEASYGSNHPAVVPVLSNLAGVLTLTTRFAEAEPLIRRALAITEHYGSNHQDVARELGNLAILLDAAGRGLEAVPLMRRAVEVYEKFERDGGHRHPNHEATLELLAALEESLSGAARGASAEPKSGAMQSGPQGLTPESAALPPTGKRGLMGGLFPRRV
jgi:hypothetical protein